MMILNRLDIDKNLSFASKLDIKDRWELIVAMTHEMASNKMLEDKFDMLR